MEGPYKLKCELLARVGRRMWDQAILCSDTWHHMVAVVCLCRCNQNSISKLCSHRGTHHGLTGGGGSAAELCAAEEGARGAADSPQEPGEAHRLSSWMWQIAIWVKQGTGWVGLGVASKLGGRGCAACMASMRFACSACLDRGGALFMNVDLWSMCLPMCRSCVARRRWRQ